MHLTSGFNVITGETGAGKSIIIDAVELVLGGRADVDFVRAGSEKAVVEGVFKLPTHLKAHVKAQLEAEGIEMESPEEVTLTRELRTNGRSVCRVNGSTVSLQFYREIGEKLVDIHGQSEHLSLLKAAEHLALLDRYANLQAEQRQFAVVVDELYEVRRERNSLQQDATALERRVDMLKYQIEEIQAVNPHVGEDTELREESTRLANADQLARLTNEIQAALDGEDETVVSAVPLLNQVEVMLGKLSKIDPKLEEHHVTAGNLASQAADLVLAIRHYADSVEHDPHRLNEVEDRLDALHRLNRKYGGSIEAVLQFREKSERELEGIHNSGERLAELAKQEETLLHRLGTMAKKLTVARKAASTKLARGIETELVDLKMDGARFEVGMTQSEDEQGAYVDDKRLAFDHTGTDQIEFLMAANRGEPLRPMIKVASGGETARIMLALKGVLSRADETPTLIFDEIDQGIGGRVGAIVGQKLWNLSMEHQVLCITHLAQLAGFGDSHYKVSKGARGDRTVTSIVPLNDKMRVDELADMLGAETLSARQSAHDILMLARRTKEGRAHNDMQTPLPQN